MENSIGFPFIELSKVESTNNYAMGLVHAGMAQHGTAVFAHDQTKGKGQRHKQWISEANKNIILSIVVKTIGLQTSQLFLLSMAVAVGVQKFFTSYSGNDTKIKWPNDVYWRDRKAGGILIENIIQGDEWKYAIIGIGLNINQTDFGEFNRAVSLRQITGESYDTIKMSKDLLVFLDATFKELTTDVTIVVDQYHQHLYKWKENIHFKKDNENFKGILKEVRTDGLLIIKTDKEEAFKVGEIEWMD